MNLNSTIRWLLEGDPAIRWQTLRDLAGAPEQDWRAEKQRTTEEGWGARLLAEQSPDGRWGGGLYSPKWISSTYTLLALIGIGIPPETESARQGARLVIDGLLGPTLSPPFPEKLAGGDRCIIGMILQIALYFGIDDERIDAIIANLISEQMPDGGWNCRRTRDKTTRHSSVHTTLNVLDGLRLVIEQRPSTPRLNEVRSAEDAALEWLLMHRLYKSDHTMQVINQQFTQFVYPYRWHYDVLRGLEYFARAESWREARLREARLRDIRLQDAIDLLKSKQMPGGEWPLENKYHNQVFFNMEKVGAPSRWNTLRALRVLNWWEKN